MGKENYKGREIFMWLTKKQKKLLLHKELEEFYENEGSMSSKLQGEVLNCYDHNIGIEAKENYEEIDSIYRVLKDSHVLSKIDAHIPLSTAEIHGVKGILEHQLPWGKYFLHKFYLKLDEVYLDEAQKNFDMLKANPPTIKNSREEIEAWKNNYRRYYYYIYLIKQEQNTITKTFKSLWSLEITLTLALQL